LLERRPTAIRRHRRVKDCHVDLRAPGYVSLLWMSCLPRRASANGTETSMPMTRKFISLVALSLVVGTVSTAAFAAARRANTAESHVRQLLNLMDKDKNGTVSKEEFMEYMSQTFDRLDVDRSGQLERNELRRTSDPDWMLCHDLRMCR
jgi:EF hand